MNDMKKEDAAAAENKSTSASVIPSALTKESA
jgi:hypothetical protein